MARLLQFSSSHPWLILISLIVISLFSASTLSSLKIQVSAESLTVEDDPAWIVQQQNLKNFGDSEITVVLFRDENLFSHEKLSVIKSVIKQLTDIPEVEKVTSLFSVSNIRMDEGYISTKPFLDDIPEAQEELNQILDQARLNPLVIKNLINDKGTSFAVNLTLADERDDADFDQRVSRSIENVIRQYQIDFDQILQIGSPYIRDTITRKISTDQQSIMPWSVVLLVIALAIGMRSLSGALIPLFTAGVSILWTLAGMALLEIPIGVMTSIVPALLIIIGSTEDIHIISEYKGNLAQGLTPPHALENMSRTIGIAILLTFITTYFGFISIYTNEITLLKEFGLVASTGLLINFLITSLSVPALLKITANQGQKARKSEESKLSVYSRLAITILKAVLRHKILTIGLLSIVVIWSVYGVLSLKVNNNPLGYFDADTAVVRSAETLHKNIAGIETFSIIMETGIEDTFKKVKYLEEIDKVQQYVNASGLFDKSISFNDFMKVIHLAMDEGEISALNELYLPEEDALVREYLEFVKHDLFKSYVTRDYSETRILVRHAINDSSELREAISELEKFIEDNIDDALKVKITGSSIVSANASDYMAEGQGKSLLLMSLVIILVVSILFVNWQAGVVALIPNLFPIVVLFGVMGHMGIALDTGTAMVAVIALGICVDDTVHFMTRYHQRSRNRDDPDGALRDTVIDESVPIFTTSLALMLGFLTFSWSSFVPIAYFGLLSAMVMLLALITTFVITPLLLHYIHLVTMWDMLSLQLQAKVIDSCPLFKDMTSWSIKKTILSSEVKDYKPGQKIIEQGSVGDEMYVILEGQVDIKIKQDDGSVVTVNHMNEGGLFGEVALVSKIPRTASVVSTSNSRLLSLKWESIERLSRFHTRTAMKVFHNLASIVGSKITNINSISSLRDELSGCLNRSMVEELIDLELFKAMRYKEPMSFISFTLRSPLNDEYFTMMLVELSEKVRSDIRNVDILARWNEQRFIVLLPRTTAEDCHKIILGRIEHHLSTVLDEYGHNQERNVRIWTFDGVMPLETIRKQTRNILDAPLDDG